MKKIGFCKQCMRNVPHVLYFSWPVFRYLNQHLEFANSLPMGSWHCCGCERNSFTIKRPDPEVTTDMTSTTMSDIVDWPDRNDRSQRTGLLFHRKRKSTTTKSNATEEPDVEFEHVGNVTRGDDSLLVRKARAARYSKKFRESVVERILTGKSTISQLRNELGLSERDLLDWINEKVMVQSSQIKKLSQVVNAVKHLAIEVTPSDATHEQSRPRIYEDADDYQSKASGRAEGKTVDGQINHG